MDEGRVRFPVGPQIFLILIPVSGESCYTRAHDGTGAQGINESSGSETAGDTAT